MLVLVWLSGPECYLPEFMIVVSPGELPTLTFNYSWCLFIISCPLFWTDTSCLSSVVVHPSSHKTNNDISGSVLDLWKI